MEQQRRYFLYLAITLNLLIPNIFGLSSNEIEDDIFDDVKIFTVASEPTDGYLRYLWSADHYKIKFTTLGMGKIWNGGDMSSVGGGQKINYLKEAVESLKDKKSTIIMFTDSYDVVFATGLADIIKKFKQTGAKILFGAEHYCWPDKMLIEKYPAVGAHGARFLNSGMFIGYAPYVYKMLTSIDIKDAEDDQLAYTKLFVDSEKRKTLGMELDWKSEIFQNLYGASDDVKLDIDLQTTEGTLRNIHFMTTPSVIHGNGLSKVFLNALANYLGGTFKERNCLICEQGKITLDETNLPSISLSIFAEKPVPFFEEFLDKILTINYPKKNIHLFIYCNAAYHDPLIKTFVKLYGPEYKSLKYIYSDDKISVESARTLSIQLAKDKKSDYLFVVDNFVHLDEPEILRDLLIYNRTFIAPVIARTNELWSNFWGALNDHGYYARSHDYVDIVKRALTGMWNVPYISTAYLVKSSAFDSLKYKNKEVDLDMALCEELRSKGIFMYVTNEKYYGHLVDYEEFNTQLTSPDFYQLLKNPKDWEQRYIHEDYQKQLEAGFKHMQPCPDVYWFPIATEKFCDDLVNIMEGFGKWSDGTNSDERLQGGYEAVPTRDIHMNQVGLEKLWLAFLKDYVRPLQEAVFLGYYHNPPRSLMNFVVRYRPDEQPALRPHHDSSTFTINIALNRAGIDYTGGGCRFVRYNCSVTDTKKGWMLMHPGRLTHYHEGLRTTNGTRYIMISFVDP
ncbi:procollagen-lysine,2-oxoglutarate 5-dioxygenase [Condylostylus longicornis]|uniref:procollagen-lysine,2-oxoglutarate 5-dioxygenase n=1 Tax=Condylostylus longicornis TaxID=2530218 RepID=UPI00244E1D80|nr:procollagen-lysine,2-oxoglutarate 5-dioxygenase [Condylostylus longicornis]